MSRTIGQIQNNPSESRDLLESEFQMMLPQMKLRREELLSTGIILEGLDWEDLSRSEKYFPVRFLADGISAYTYCFDNAAIYYAWLAVENALLIRLGTDGFNQGERRLVHLARSKGILSRDRERIAHRLRKVRNIYTHYINVMWQQRSIDFEVRNLIQRKSPQILKAFQQNADKEHQPEIITSIEAMMREVANDTLIESRGVPLRMHKPPNKESARYLNKRVKDYLEWVYRGGDEAERGRRVEYGVERKDALDGLNWSAGLLKYLGVLPSEHQES